MNGYEVMGKVRPVVRMQGRSILGEEELVLVVFLVAGIVASVAGAAVAQWIVRVL